MPAKCALHIVRDPISILKALCNLQTPKEHCDEEADFTSLDQNDKMVQKIKRIGKKTLAYTLDVDPYEILKDKVLYRINTQNSRGGDTLSIQMPVLASFGQEKLHKDFTMAC